MEQLQVVLAHLKAHRFWYSLGLAVVFAYLVSSGIGDVKQKTAALEKQLEDSFTAVKGYQSGDRANAQWQTAVSDKKGVLDTDFASSHEQLYLEQEKLMTWPKEVAEPFKGRPFAAPLDDKQSIYISEYRKACDELGQVAAAFWELNVLDKQDDGTLFGIIDVGPSPTAVMTSVIQFPEWQDDPKSMEAWYAQEMLWIQRAVIRSIGKINRQAAEAFEREKGWLNAPIKRLYRINIGGDAMDQGSLAAKKELVEYQADPAQAQAPSSGPSTAQAVNPRRYIEKTDSYRLVPVSVHLLIDQARITDVLTGLANTDFKYTIGESRILYPEERVDLPVLLKEAGVTMPGRGAENPLYNCVDLNVYGTMRFYEIPKPIKERREKAAKGEAPSEPTPAPTETVPPPKSDAKSPEAPKSDAKASGDAAKAAAPPAAEPTKGDAPPTKSDDRQADEKKAGAPSKEKTDEGKKAAPKEDASPKKEASDGKASKDPTAGGAPKDPTAGGGKSDSGKKKE